MSSKVLVPINSVHTSQYFLLLIFLIIVILVDTKWYLIVVLICLSQWLIILRFFSVLIRDLSVVVHEVTFLSPSITLSYTSSQFHFRLAYLSLQPRLQVQMRRLWALWFVFYQFCYFELMKTCIFLTQCLPSIRRPSNAHSWPHTGEANSHQWSQGSGCGKRPLMPIVLTWSSGDFLRIKAS